MKTAVTILIALAVLSLGALSAHATVLMSEPFPYPNGNLGVAPVATGSPWTCHSGSGSGDIQVTNHLAFGNMANFPDDNRTFTAQTATAKTYACFQVIIPVQSNAMVSNYFAHFKNASTGFPSRVYAVPMGSTFTFGLSVNTCTSLSCLVTWPTALQFGHMYNVAISYDAAAGTSELWVDPATESSQKITITDTGQKSLLVSAFALRQSNQSAPVSGTPCAWTYVVDNISVGTSFTDACSGQPVPVHNSSWGSLKRIYR
ncbi:MAG TPA: hypothetical protein VMS93_03455 [Candidatus Saccharimonadales bacterium]|nr:hypothetical protein [Candidatus Saccharimonadales bacterium]